MSEKIEIVHDIDMKKRLIDGLEETHLPLFFPSFGNEEYQIMKELEETFYYPPETHFEEFQIWNKQMIAYFRFTGISKDDGTKTTALWIISRLMHSPLSVLFLIKKDPKLRKRFDYITKKYNLKFKYPEDGPNKNYLNGKEKIEKKRNPIESRLRHEVFKRDDYQCKECRKSNKESTLHADHILPVSQGGTDELDNLQTLCQACNLAKSNRNWKGGKDETTSE